MVDKEGKEEFRIYDENYRVKGFYLQQHVFQSYDLVLKKEKEHLGFSKGKMEIWEAMDFLNTLIDDSDPDTQLSQLEHLMQSAEATRNDGHPEWFQLTALIHDLGKILCLYEKEKNGDELQWAVVGDSFPVGCPYSDKIVYSDDRFFDLNPDFKNKAFRKNTKKHFGVYEKGCGLENVRMSWGHDEYLFRVIENHYKENPELKHKLPDEALYMIRFHSFYPWYNKGAYTELMNEKDHKMLPWVQKFQHYDLYSKEDSPPDIDKLKSYYSKLTDKFFPDKLQW